MRRWSPLMKNIRAYIITASRVKEARGNCIYLYLSLSLSLRALTYSSHLATRDCLPSCPPLSFLSSFSLTPRPLLSSYFYRLLYVLFLLRFALGKLRPGEVGELRSSVGNSQLQLRSPIVRVDQRARARGRGEERRREDREARAHIHTGKVRN